MQKILTSEQYSILRQQGTGWPSFWAPISAEALVLREDVSIPGETRTEVLDKC